MIHLPEKIPAITLWQPWASLIAAGQKCYETRSWQRSYRGPLAIHSANRWTPTRPAQLPLFEDMPLIHAG